MKTVAFDLRIRTGVGFKTDAENAAISIRRALGLGSADRLPARTLAKEMKISVALPQQITGITREQLDELLGKNSREWSAAFLPAEAPHRSLIIHNPTNHEHRQESDIFHELGHQLCGHEAEDFEIIGGLPMRRFPEEKEEQAQFLGYALHLPKDALFWAHKKGMTNEEIGSYFCASQSVVTMRMNRTGVAKILQRSAEKYGRPK